MVNAVQVQEELIYLTERKDTHTTVTKAASLLGVPTKNPRTNELDSSMLKSKNQVTLFGNYSYNSFNDFRPSKNKQSKQRVMCQNMGVLILYGGLYMNIPEEEGYLLSTTVRAIVDNR